MSEMSDATNDTTRTARALELANQRTPWTGPQLCEIDGMLRHYAAVLTDLDRLAGPVCDHPPCKGARAVEHAHHGRNIVDRNHPPAPAIEAWLRERAK